ncbi:TIGR03619 family F420-dependent LLM class oxidoreductase [Actinophytocola sediminis]
MRFGIVLFTSDRGITPAACAKAAEDAGFYSFYVPEHTHIPVRRDAAHPHTGSADLPDDRYLRTLDPWVSLATAAAATSSIRLATAVALPVESDPITLAKTVATLDFLSGGRVTLGAGFGWNTDELADHGIPARFRYTALREYVAAMRALWTEDVASYEGRFVSFGGSWAYPKPVQDHIPVLIGAGGTDRTFTWLAANADGWITTPYETDLDERIQLLHKHWSAAGRPGAPYVVALGGRADPDRVAHLASLGVAEVVIGVPDKDEDAVLAFIAKMGARLGLG